MLQALLVTFREGVEAFLIIGVIAAYLRKTNGAELMRGVRIGIAASIVTSLGGAWLWMQVPNQPIGGAREIIQWWNQYFPARPGHWSGFEILSYPAFSRIEFTNAERTQAQVPFAIGFSGSTVALEKVNGAWVMKELTGNFWIQ